MRAGELQRLAQRVGETEAMNEAEPGGEQPAPREPAPRGLNDILQRHVNDGNCDQRLDERREPQADRNETEGSRDQRDRVADREGGDNDDEQSQPAEWNHEAEQEQEVVDAAKDMQHAVGQERQGGLLPARIEAIWPGSP